VEKTAKLSVAVAIAAMLVCASVSATATIQPNEQQLKFGGHYRLINIRESVEKKGRGILVPCGKYFASSAEGDDDETISFISRKEQGAIKKGQSQVFSLITAPKENLRVLIGEGSNPSSPVATLGRSAGGKFRITIKMNMADYLESPCLAEMTRT
jgi:hypothetical protein